MSIKYIKDDLFNSKTDIIGHGCNCAGGFGSGVAKQIATRYPKTRFYYLDKFDSEGWTLGEVQYVSQWDGKIIANCATQFQYLPRDICHANYEGIQKCMLNLKAYMTKHNKTLAMPKIGAGLAGGDWDIIEKIINDVFNDIEVFVYHLD